MAKKVEFFDGAQSSTTPVIGDVDASNVASYVNDAAYEAANVGSPIAGNIYYNTTLNMVRYYNGSAWQSIIDEPSTQVLTNKTIDADQNNISNIEDADIKAGAAIDATKISTGNVSNTEFDYLDGVTGPIQAQLNAAAAISGATDNRLVRTDGASNIQESGITVDDLDNVTGINDLTISGDLTVLGTTTSVNSTTLDVADANITVNDGGNKASADGIAGLTVEMSDETDVTLLYDSSLASRFKAGDSGSEKELVNVDSAQVLTNKDLSDSSNDLTTASADSLTRKTGNQSLISIPDAPSADSFLLANQTQSVTNKDVDGGIASNSNRITLPKNSKSNLDSLTRKEGTIVYASDEKRFYGDDGLVLASLGGSGAGGINFIENFNFESNINGYAAYADAAGASPVDGTGGTPSVTITRETGASFILRNEASLKLAKDAVNRQGEGFSVDFTIDNIDSIASKELSISFNYRTQGTYVNGDIKVFVYDIDTNTVLGVVSTLNPSGELTAQANGDKFIGSFFTVPGSLNYRLIFHAASTSALAYDFYLDHVKVGPEEALVVEGLEEALIVDQKPSGTAGGTLTSGGWIKRDLNTISGTTWFVSVTSSVITLQPGTYKIKASCPAFAVNQHQIRLRNTTAGSTVKSGSSEYAATSAAASTRSVLVADFTIASATDFEIQHRVNTTGTTNGAGVTAGFGEPEIYTIVEITRY